jgi:hypothetical protein
MTQQQASPRLRLDRRFFEACDRLPMSARAAVLECLTKLLENPAHPSLKYESVRRAADPRMRSIRINEQYRAIVAHPEGGSEYLLLWVDKHDEAYSWAARHRFKTNSSLGGLEIVELLVRQEQPEAQNGVPAQALREQVAWQVIMAAMCGALGSNCWTDRRRTSPSTFQQLADPKLCGS